MLPGLPLALAACGLSERPYSEQRQWPLLVRRPTALPARSALQARSGGLVLEVRGLRASPGLETRGLQTVQPDGSIQTGFYEQWAVPPAQGVEESLRQWLADSGLFAAVVAPGSRSQADWSLEGELTVLWTAADAAHAALAITLIDVRSPARRILLQQSFTAQAVLQGADVPAAVQAQLAALSDIMGRVETALWVRARA
jgi:ABC-type uncharacterized transport system auxiliary subunit